MFRGGSSFFVGSTAKRLIRKCPSAVWIVKAEHVQALKVILALSDFSDVSRKAVLKGLCLPDFKGHMGATFMITNNTFKFKERRL